MLILTDLKRERMKFILPDTLQIAENVVTLIQIGFLNIVHAFETALNFFLKKLLFILSNKIFFLNILNREVITLLFPTKETSPLIHFTKFEPFR